MGSSGKKLVSNFAEKMPQSQPEGPPPPGPQGVAAKENYKAPDAWRKKTILSQQGAPDQTLGSGNGATLLA